MIIVTGSVETTLENFSSVLRLSLEHVERSRTEPGCISHSATIDADNNCRLVFFEEWADMPSLQKHFAVLESKKFVDDVSSMALRAPELKMYQAELLS